MTTVFLSYSTKNHDFAELLVEKLSRAGISVWRDQGHLLPGSDWREGIEEGIASSAAVLVAVSTYASQSSYVTFEWAYGLGKGKIIIPLKLEECPIHPRLASLQHIDFSATNASRWQSLIERIGKIEARKDAQRVTSAVTAVPDTGPSDDVLIEAILAHLRHRKINMMGFEKLRQHVHESLTEERAKELILRNPRVFRRATLSGARPGIAKVVP